jgi:LysM repeat protein
MRSFTFRAMSLLLRCTALLLCLALGGCLPGSRDQADEQRESYFLVAKKRLQERDYRGAIGYFEKALDVNPRSASAHFELGVLYEQQSDYASALYHYQRTLAIRPDISTAEIIRQHIEQCKRELAKSVVQLPSVENLHREVDRLRAENQELKRYLQAWQNYYKGRGVTLSNILHGTATNAAHVPGAVDARAQTRDSAGNTGRTVAPARSAARPVANRTHTIVSGDTLSAIARKYGVNLSALQAANPGVDPRRLRPGHSLVIPPSR